MSVCKNTVGTVKNVVLAVYSQHSSLDQTQPLQQISFGFPTEYLCSSLPSLCATTLQTASERSLTCASDILFFNVAIPVSHHAWEEFHALILFISIDKLESIK